MNNKARVGALTTKSWRGGMRNKGLLPVTPAGHDTVQQLWRAAHWLLCAVPGASPHIIFFQRIILFLFQLLSPHLSFSSTLWKVWIKDTQAYLVYIYVTGFLCINNPRYIYVWAAFHGKVRNPDTERNKVDMNLCPRTRSPPRNMKDSHYIRIVCSNTHTYIPQLSRGSSVTSRSRNRQVSKAAFFFSNAARSPNEHAVRHLIMRSMFTSKKLI